MNSLIFEVSNISEELVLLGEKVSDLNTSTRWLNDEYLIYDAKCEKDLIDIGIMYREMKIKYKQQAELLNMYSNEFKKLTINLSEKQDELLSKCFEAEKVNKEIGGDNNV